MNTEPDLLVEFKRCIAALNHEFNLDIRQPDPTLSPSKRRMTFQPVGERLYKQIHALSFSLKPQLLLGLEQFRREALSLHQTSSHDVFSQQAKLQDCLVRCLPDPKTILQKRTASDAAQQPKRLRSQCSRDDTSSARISTSSPLRDLPAKTHPLKQTSVAISIDDIPVRSSPTFLKRDRPEIIMINDSDSDSDADPVFSGRNGSSIFDRSRTTSANTSFASTSTELATVGISSALQEMEIASNITELHKSDGNKDPDSSRGTLDSSQETLESKLRNVWPKLPHFGPTEPPLAVMWEVTRFALHCGVNLDEILLDYRNNDTWNEQVKMRQHIASLPQFQGKVLPPSSDPGAWRAALDNFQSGVKVVILAVDLTYRADGPGPLFDVHFKPLKRPDLGHRASRRFGADRFLEINIQPLQDSDFKPKVVRTDKDAFGKVLQWLHERNPYLVGRTWAPFFIRNLTKPMRKWQVNLFAVNGNCFRAPKAPGVPSQSEADSLAVRSKCDLADFLQWTLNMDQNLDQPPLKLFSRLALSLSRTYPTVTLESNQLRHHPKDIEGTRVMGRAEGMVMNDGIGRISQSLADQVAKCLNLAETPTAFQARIGSAKGVWMVENDSTEDKWLETYPSQRKWNCDFTDAQHRVFEVKIWSKRTSPANVNEQLLPIIYQRARNKEAMRDTLSKNLVEHVHSELALDGSDLSTPEKCRLWLRSDIAWSHREAPNYISFLGGLPENHAICAAFLIDAGFDPRKLTFLKEMIKGIGEAKVKNMMTKLNFRQTQSVNVLMLADFSGTLREGEVYLGSTAELPVDDYKTPWLEDIDVLVARTPAHLATDIRKVRAVAPKNLRRLKNVIVFSTKGERPLADMLSGGDYDGDRAWVCWDREIVDNFENAPFATPTVELNDYVRKDPTTFDTLGGKGKLDAELCRKWLGIAFSFNARDSWLGMCTIFKENMLYHHSCSIEDERIVNLSELLSALVDQSKQGTVFTRQDWHKFVTEVLQAELSLQGKYPAYSEKRKDGPRLQRKQGSFHILDHLRFKVADPTLEDAKRIFFQSLAGDKDQEYDEHLRHLGVGFEELGKQSTALKAILTQLEKDLEKVYETWKSHRRVGPYAKNDYYTRSLTEDNNFPEMVKEAHRQWSNICYSPDLIKDCHFSPYVMTLLSDDPSSGGMWELLKASMTLRRFYKRSKFVWHVAGRSLATLKGLRTGESFQVSPQIWSALRPDRKVIEADAAAAALRDPVDSAGALHEVAWYDDDGYVFDDT